MKVSMKGLTTMPTYYTILLLACLQLLIVGAVQKFSNQWDQVLQSDHEIIIPYEIDHGGQYVSHDLPARRLRRSIDQTTTSTQEDHTLHFHINSTQDTFHLQIKPHHSLLANTFQIHHRKTVRRGTNGTFVRVTELKELEDHCLYEGTSLQHSGSVVALSLCDGMSGVIHTSTATYLLEPLSQDLAHHVQQHKTNHTSSHKLTKGRPHVLYKYKGPSPSSKGPPKDAQQSQPMNDESNEVCPAQEMSKESTIVSQAFKYFDDISQAHESSHHRSKRSTKDTKNVETIVVVDKEMLHEHGEQNVTTYVLTLLNMVSKLFHDKSIGTKINISLVALILLEGDEPGLVVNNHADQALTNFCHWQSNLEGIHHDHAILLTGVDLCAHDDHLCDTLGFAPIEGMCKRYRSCTINEDTGLGTAFTVTHEAGHNLGMLHDGEGNYCEIGDGSIMAPTLFGSSGVFKWSACSRKYLNKFIESGKAYCLDNEPRKRSELRFPDKLPGELYDADVQCKWQFGNRASMCMFDFGSDLCKSLWCYTGGRKCETKFLPAAEGTSCGLGKWCRKGMCVQYGNDGPAPIDGGWSRYSEWRECSRTCGGGVMFKERKCNRPRPQYGGSDCMGESRLYKMCNMQACPKEAIDFRAEQCKSHDNRIFRGQYYTWQPFTNTPEEDWCRLFCKADHYDFYFALSNKVIDGTRCRNGSDNVCVEGECYSVGCDGVIDSGAVMDRCGVCRGDNSTCHFTSGVIDRNMPLNAYFPVLTIPKGARSIVIREASLSPSYIAIKSSRGSYYLNGAWRVSWPGRYNIAGTSMEYKRPYNEPESITADGPLLNDVIIEILVQGKTPIIEYRYTTAKVIDDVHPQPPRHNYTWTVATSACSATCGTGRKLVTVRCLRDLREEVHHNYCPATSKPKSGIMACNMETCHPRWVPQSWSSCSASCGGGYQRRRVQCLQQTSDSEEGTSKEKRVKNKLCRHLERPERRQTCNTHECPPEWQVGLWSQCSATCDKGQRSRIVRCRSTKRELPDEMCSSQGPKPNTTDVCQDRACAPLHRWFLSSWSDCSVTCGIGLRTRKFKCSGRDPVSGQYKVIDDGRCRGISKPVVRLKEACQKMMCAANSRWFVSPWGKCSKSCGKGGTQSRLVKCMDESTGLTTTGCRSDNKPITTRSCSQHRKCPKETMRSSCRDTFQWCDLVPSHNLCGHKFYGVRCCHSCARARHEKGI